MVGRSRGVDTLSSFLTNATDKQESSAMAFHLQFVGVDLCVEWRSSFARYVDVNSGIPRWLWLRQERHRHWNVYGVSHIPELRVQGLIWDL